MHKAQLNWSTIEKEAYANFYTITKFDFLLRDVKFVVETDHKNLTFLKTAQSAKVRRWQLTLQEFDFEYKHMDGESAEMLTAFLMTGDSIGSNAPTYQSRSNSNSKSVTTEPSIDPSL